MKRLSMWVNTNNNYEPSYHFVYLDKVQRKKSLNNYIACYRYGLLYNNKKRISSVLERVKSDKSLIEVIAEAARESKYNKNKMVPILNGTRQQLINYLDWCILQKLPDVSLRLDTDGLGPELRMNFRFSVKLLRENFLRGRAFISPWLNIWSDYVDIVPSSELTWPDEVIRRLLEDPGMIFGSAVDLISRSYHLNKKVKKGSKKVLSF